MDDSREFRIGPFSLGDIIALGGVLVACGALWSQVQVVAKEQDRQAMRLQALEQVIPSDFAAAHSTAIAAFIVGVVLGAVIF